MGDQLPKVFKTVPEAAGRVISMVMWRERLMVACEYRLYEVIDNEMVEIEFINLENKDEA